MPGFFVYTMGIFGNKKQPNSIVEVLYKNVRPFPPENKKLVRADVLVQNTPRSEAEITDLSREIYNYFSDGGRYLVELDIWVDKNQWMLNVQYNNSIRKDGSGQDAREKEFKESNWVPMCESIISHQTINSGEVVIYPLVDFQYYQYGGKLQIDRI